MENIDLVEQSKIKSFLTACDELIGGKFILADIKIVKVLNLIADCEPLYRYIGECLIDYNFEKEYSKAEVKNHFNNSEFLVPQESDKLVAFVYCLFTCIEKRQINLFNFVKNNFPTLNAGAEYDNFTNSLVVPFKNAIAVHFGLMVDNGKVNEDQVQSQNEEASEEEQEKDEIEVIWDDIAILVDSLANIIATERKLKTEPKEQILYIVNSIKYCSKYKDMRIVSSLIMSAEMLLDRIHSTKIVISEIKNEIKSYYDIVAQRQQSQQ